VSRLAGGADPFAVLGLPPRADLTDDDVRAAWRRIATATHPDRGDGGDPRRFAVAAAAYTVLRTRSGRGEALADLASPSPAPARPPAPRPRRGDAPPRMGHPGAARTQALARPGAPPGPGTAARPDAPAVTWPAHLGAARLLSRIRRGRPARLALRVLIAAALSAVAVAVAGSQPATPALITGALTWLMLTVRHDLAPPP
jgi:curved DNA-binding protein CbpA